MADRLNDRELGAVLAGLRLLQGLREGKVTTGSADMDVAIDEIESGGGAHDVLQPDEIDELCERLNCSDLAA